MKNKKKTGILLKYSLLGVLMVIGLSGCGKPVAKEPVTVTIWHVYGGQAESPLNDMIAQFNETVGKEENIQVQVGSVTNTNTIHENVLSSAYGDPGAEELGYMPVKQESFEKYLPDAISELKDPMYKSLYEAFLQTQEQYIFYTAPQYDTYLDMETKFDELVRQKLQIAHRSFMEFPEQSLEELSETAYESFNQDYQP